MKKLLAIILLFITLTAVTGCGEVRREPLSKCRRNGLVYIVNEQQPYSGIIFEQRDNGQLKSEVSYKGGKQDGVRKEWHENGQLKIEATYKDGALNGTSKSWYENGQLKSEGSFKDGKEDK